MQGLNGCENEAANALAMCLSNVVMSPYYDAALYCCITVQNQPLFHKEDHIVPFFIPETIMTKLLRRLYDTSINYFGCECFEESLLSEVNSLVFFLFARQGMLSSHYIALALLSSHDVTTAASLT